MPDIPEIPETAPGRTPNATLGAPTEAAPAAPAAAVAPASRPEPSVADTARLLAEHFPALFGAGVIKPIKLRIKATSEVALCNCKHTGNKPYCDGTHTRLENPGA